jgi:hypothetical protein
MPLCEYFNKFHIYWSHAVFNWQQATNHNDMVAQRTHGPLSNASGITIFLLEKYCRWIFPIMPCPVIMDLKAEIKQLNLIKCN